MNEQVMAFCSFILVLLSARTNRALFSFSFPLQLFLYFVVDLKGK